jgi:hypothetical protein
MVDVMRPPARPLSLQRSIRLLLQAAFGVLCLAESAPAADPSPSLERAVKASYLFKFAPFVQWPASALPGSTNAFTICLRGEDPFGSTLDDVVRGQKIAGRATRVRRLADSDEAAGCHILFAGRSTLAGYTPFAGVSGMPVLTVSDKGSGIPGAMIVFVMENGRVRFQINDGAARANSLIISSKLLGLAVAVDRK